ncbi:hypothetical protein H6P81_012876 [Aristolochia fimbriata]|uniref:Uncharacterized protein n=1 Tax=Aristolochia fimbriata TaxID=158543 RepID=A0AAV7EGB2_ARIFI|nr:hypothetical protein H6P81_012875 [Aristolochia fimbriata]KAG9446748.1 hypothetical protein H6P81_012876 [Aristolochia fimbriata]
MGFDHGCKGGVEGVHPTQIREALVCHLVDHLTASRAYSDNVAGSERPEEFVHTSGDEGERIPTLLDHPWVRQEELPLLLSSVCGLNFRRRCRRDHRTEEEHRDQEDTGGG